MTTLLLAGAGAVGTRAARQLVDTPGVDRLLVASRHRPDALAEALGDRAEALPYDADDPVPGGVDAVASALPSPLDAGLARRCIERGVPFASAGDDPAVTDVLLDLDGAARAAGVTVAVGCGLAPGLADVLVRHAADALERVDEVRIARAGVAGAASLATLRRARREPSLEWRDGDWQSDRRDGPEIVWFPDPIDARECRPVAAGVRLVVGSLEGVARVSVRFDEPASRNPIARLAQRGDVSGWGAVRVEVWGWRGRAREPLVYGVIDRTAVAAGTVLAVVAVRLAGLEPALTLRTSEPGAHGLAALLEPAPVLAELARRGVKAAAFEGVGVA